MSNVDRRAAELARLAEARGGKPDKAEKPEPAPEAKDEKKDK